MPRQQSIPLFLWVAAAIVAHAIGGGGVETVALIKEQTLDLEQFTSEVRSAARRGLAPLDMSTIDEDEWEINLDDFEAQPEQAQEPDNPDAFDQDALKNLTPEAKKKEEEKAKAPPQPLQAEAPTVPPAEPQPSPPANDQRIAIDQHVDNKEQQDNPNARFAADDAQTVEEETQAKITARDAATDQEPTPGTSDRPPEEEIGNDDETEIRESEESEGDPNELPSEAVAALDPQAQERPPAESSVSEAASPAAQEANEAEEQEQQDAAPELVEAANGRFTLSRPMTPAEATAASRRNDGNAHGHSHSLPKNYQDLLGLGSSGTTSNGINLNLSQTAANTLIGAEQMAALRKKQGERRLSKHRGSWENQGLERWRPALENYVASVKIGNTTALNAARVPFASYLNHIHQRLHLIFAQRFLGYLSRFPADHPINNPEISTHLEVALSRHDGKIVKIGVIKSSGVTAFDIGALDSVTKAGPYGVPPEAILSADGNV